jgi:hypothetical protein
MKHGGDTARKHLGSGLFVCDVCGDPVRTSSNRYWCPKGGHILRTMSYVDEFVLELIEQRLNEPDVVTRMSEREDPAQNEDESRLEALQNRLARIEADYDADFIDGRRYQESSNKVRAEIQELQASRAQKVAGRAVALALNADDPGKYFRNATLAVQRTFIDALVSIRLKPGAQGKKGFNMDSLEWTWKQF